MVYLPATSAKHTLDDYLEYLHYLSVIYDKLSSEGFLAILKDFNGDLGNSLGDKGIKETSQRGLKLLELANHFNLCTVNLLETCQVQLNHMFPTVAGLDIQLIMFSYSIAQLINWIDGLLYKLF